MRRKGALCSKSQRIIFDQALLKSLDGLKLLDGTFPDHEDISALIPKSHFIPGILFQGLPDLFLPPYRPRLREPEVFAVLVPVLATAVDGDDGFVLGPVKG